MERAIEITSKNGRRYQFVEWTLFRTAVETFCLYDGRWIHIDKSFNSFEDAIEWIQEIDRQFEAKKTATPSAISMPSSAYYSITGYYGD
ncbi:MAG: hypothetical protein IAB75_06070 [Bacteroidetes bacterium]|uniref:Uncharacterized protein n=1 Tax=Candidatus Cryptobacteroides avicola TaxID=2840757 RepID=A0A940DSD7_9BACT|nr:hypothetical protein [Candidatus Cryptobacteroides avicola]